MINAIAIRTLGKDALANELARTLADPALRREAAELLKRAEGLEKEIEELRRQNRWLEEKVRLKQKVIEQAYGPRLDDYRRDIARRLNRRNRWMRFANALRSFASLFVERDPVEPEEGEEPNA